MADAQYVIDIAAGMSGGDQTTAELDALAADLMGAGKGAEFFEQAIVQVSAQLAAASTAAVSANAALASGNVQYAQLEKAAINAAKAAERAAISNAGVVPPELAARVQATSGALDAHAVTLSHLEKEAHAANEAEAQLGSTLKNVKQLSGHVDKSFQGNAETLSKVTSALNAFGNPLGGVVAKTTGAVKGFEELSGALGADTAAMIAAAAGAAVLVVAVLAVAAAAVVATLKIAAWAIGLADVRRNADLAGQAAAAMNPELAGLSRTFADVSSETGQTSADLRALTKTLEGAKVSVQDMPAALRAAALAETALGKGGSADFVARLKEGKVAAADLADEVSGKLAPIVAKQMRSLDAQTAKFHEHIGDLFGGLDIEPVLGGLETLVGLFDKNSAAGEAMKFLFESVFQPLIDQAQNAAYVIEAFAIGFLIGLTKVYIAVKPAIKAVTEFFGFKDSSLTDTLDFAKKAGELIVPIFLVFVGVIAAVGLAIGVAVAHIVIGQAAIYALVAAVVYAGVWIVQGFLSAWEAVKTFFATLDMAKLGTDLINGLVAGITAGAGAVVTAITGVADGAIKAAKAALGIHSPSTVFAGIGDNTGAGFVEGVQGMTGAAQGAMADMVAPPAPDSPLAMQSALASPSASSAQAPASSAAAPAGGGGGKSGALVNINGPVYFSGKEASKGEVAQLAEMLTELLKGNALQVGGAA